MNDWGVRLRETVFRGAQWLEQRANPDGSFRGCERDLAGYYKSLLAFAVCGRIERGARALAYLRVHLRGPKGEFASGPTKTSLKRMQRNLANYMDGWIAIGAWLLSDYELSDDACRRLIAQQSQTHGGILTGPEKWACRSRYDLSTAASCGRASLIAGHRAAAVAAADFIAAALAHQTDAERALDLCYDDHWRSLAAPDPAERSYYRFDLSRRFRNATTGITKGRPLRRSSPSDPTGTSGGMGARVARARRRWLCGFVRYCPLSWAAWGPS